MKKIKLKPCPFCGSTRLYQHGSRFGGHYISCQSCGTSGPFIYNPGVVPLKYRKVGNYNKQSEAFCIDLEKEAADGWNERCNTPGKMAENKWVCVDEKGMYVTSRKRGESSVTNNKNKAFDFGNRQDARNYKSYMMNNFGEKLKVVNLSHDVEIGKEERCPICQNIGFVDCLTKTPCPKCGGKE